MAETYVTLHGLARAVTNLLQRTNTRTMFTAAHPIGEIIETALPFCKGILHDDLAMVAVRRLAPGDRLA